MANDDAQTDLKKRARRRLVGAAALALAAVIVLPMIMDPEPAPLGEDIQVRIPPASGANSARSPIAPPVTEPLPGAPSDTTVAEAAPTPPKPEPTSAAPKPAPATVSAKPEVPAPSTPERKPESKPEDAKPASSESARVAAILSGQVDAPVVGDDGPGFVVQVGAFSNAGSASALAEKLRQAGFKAYTRKVGSTTRVRVGPFGSRDEAESVAGRMSGKGFKGVVMPRG